MPSEQLGAAKSSGWGEGSLPQEGPQMKGVSHGNDTCHMSRSVGVSRSQDQSRPWLLSVVSWGLVRAGEKGMEEKPNK